ncbi:sensor histidine kinase [Amorphoplanes digitatis]|uniref:histidine kinase n=1 Tax=Actinoplanes digitatis TaxID=1868 RepID=A0A7W7I0P5_9ACTN|nr:sensor histidine kinase [Actinoplanes digitatis]MBB4764199.1 signal transduction histidine kinase [Actinoplanes digitatis]
MRTFRMRPAVSDAAWAGVLAVLLTALILAVPEGPGTVAATVAAVCCGLAQAATLLLMRRWPEAAMGLAIAAGIGIEALAPQVGWLGLAAAPLISYARIRPPRVSLRALAVMLALTPWSYLHGGWAELVTAVFGSLLGWAWGELARTRCIRREQERRRIVSDERARLARELHDVIAHNVSLMVVQAGAAADVFDRRPERARAALDTIQDAGRSALGELRVMLQALRPDGTEPRSPQPGLDQLDALAASLGAAGLAVAVNRAGPARIVPADVSLSAYRIVQESLTNTLRHARATRAEVDLRWTDAALHLEITDDGAPAARVPAPHGAGAGLVGMRERARLVGGSLDAGPLPAGGFRVSARLPLGAPA